MTTISKQISLGTDDCRERDRTSITLSAQDVYIGNAFSMIFDAGLRWQSVNIPRGALIVSAKLSLYLTTDYGAVIANIRGINENNTATWSGGSRPSQRPKTTATIAANESDWNNWGTDGWIDIDITAVIQEIVNRRWWAANNALAVVIEDAGGASSNFIVAYAYEYGVGARGAKLDIEYNAVPAYRLVITDLDGTPHTITDGVGELETSTELSNASDSFSFSIDNTNDVYAYIEKGCHIVISTGVGSLVKKIDGYITEVAKTLEDDTLPVIGVSGESGEIRLNHIFFSKRFYDKELSALVVAVLDAQDHTTGQTYRTLAEIDASDAYIDVTAYSVEEASYVWKSLGSAIKDLADMAGFAWYRDTDKKLHFFDPAASAIMAIIADGDLEGAPEITDVGDIVNRAVVVGGYQQTFDQDGNTQTGTTIVTSSVAKTQAFTPTEDYLSSVLVYTELAGSSASSITISIQGDSGGVADGVNMSNGQATVTFDSIVDGGYTEFRFGNPVTLTPSDQYWIVLKGTTSGGVKVGVGGGVLDFETRYPVRVAVMTDAGVSQTKYGMYMQVFKDTKIEDAQVAEIRANEMLMTVPKKVVCLTVRDDTLKAGDVVRLTLSTVGIAIDKTMKIVSSTQTLGERFIYNALEMEEI